MTQTECTCAIALSMIIFCFLQISILHLSYARCGFKHLYNELIRLFLAVGDLEYVATAKNHYKFDYDPTSQLILPNTRPRCVQKLYESAAANPVRIISKCDAFRTDGLRGFEMFFVQPVVKEPAQDQMRENVVHVGKV